VTQVDDTRAAIPKMRYSFVDIDRLQDLAAEDLVDVLGVITRVGDIGTIITKKDQREIKKRAVEITDRTKRTVEVVLWTEQAEEFNGSVGTVLAVKNARISDFQGFKNLSCSASLTQFDLNPDLEVARELALWYSQNSDSLKSEIHSISGSFNRSGSGSGLTTPVGTFKDIKEAALNQIDDKGYILKVPCTISYVKHDESAPLYYKAVPSQNQYNHKVVENTTDPKNGKPWYCPYLNQYYDSYIPRFILSLVATDFTGSQFLNCFDDCGKLFLGGNEAREVEALKNEPSKLEYIFEDALFKRYMLKLRAKEDTYGEEKRIKCIVCAVENIDYVRDGRALIEKIQNLQ